MQPFGAALNQRMSVIMFDQLSCRSDRIEIMLTFATHMYASRVRGVHLEYASRQV
jgi:hypothetical protein